MELCTSIVTWSIGSNEKFLVDTRQDFAWLFQQQQAWIAVVGISPDPAMSLSSGAARWIFLLQDI
jgi:hypothetical protein